MVGPEIHYGESLYFRQDIIKKPSLIKSHSQASLNIFKEEVQTILIKIKEKSGSEKWREFL